MVHEPHSQELWISLGAREGVFANGPHLITQAHKMAQGMISLAFTLLGQFATQNISKHTSLTAWNHNPIPCRSCQCGLAGQEEFGGRGLAEKGRWMGGEEY